MVNSSDFGMSNIFDNTLLEHGIASCSIDDEYGITEVVSIKPYPYPYKTKLAFVCLVTGGCMDIALDMKSIHLTSRTLLMVREGQVITFNRCSEKIRCIFITFRNTFLSSLNYPNRSSVILSVYDTPVFLLDDEDFNSVKLYTQVVRKTIRRNDSPNRMEIIRHLTLALFYSIQHIHTEPGIKKTSRNETIFNEFLKLVGLYFRKKRTVSFYADKLCISSKHLAVVVKNVSGKSALTWIDNYIMLEAKALLKSTNLTVLQICDELHFPSQSFFGKFFKRHTGMSPTEYRSS